MFYPLFHCFNTLFGVRLFNYVSFRAIIAGVVALCMIIVSASPLFGQNYHQNQTGPLSAPQETILSGTLHLYLVTDYGENMQEVDRYRTAGEGSMIAFILKTDRKIDMAQYLDKEDVENLKDYAGTTWQSEFMVVPDWDAFESFSNESFAAQYAHNRVRVTGTLFFPMGGWRNVTPVRMDFGKVEVDSTIFGTNKN